MARQRLLLVALGALLCACEGFIGGSDDEPQGTPVDVNPVGTANPVDHPPLDAPIVSSGARRLTVEQLRRSIPVAMGSTAAGEPITWQVGSKKGLDDNADTLGEADYISTTEDNMEPSPLYLKFMDDAARDVCKRALDADEAQTDAEKRTITRHADPNANLRYLKLRFHGIKVADDDSTSIAELRKLYDGAVATADEREGWHVVCVSLLTAPEFHIY